MFGRRNHWSAGNAAYKHGDYRRALRHFGLVGEQGREADRQSLAYAEGLCHFELGDYEAAKHRFEEALDLGPVAPEIQQWWNSSVYKQASQLFEQEQYEEAAEGFKLLLASPGTSEKQLRAAMLWLGLCYQLAAEYENALLTFAETVRLFPDAAQAKECLAYLIATAPDVRLRDGRRARELAEEAVANPASTRWSCLTLLAAAEAELGDFYHAVEHYREALEMMPQEHRSCRRATYEQLQRREPIRCDPLLDRSRLYRKQVH